MSQHHQSSVLNVHPIACFSTIQCSECSSMECSSPIQCSECSSMECSSPIQGSECPSHGMFQHHLVFWPGDQCCCRWTESSCLDGCRSALFLDRVQQIVKERFYLTVRRRKLRSMQVFNAVPRTSQVVLEWACLCKFFFPDSWPYSFRRQHHFLFSVIFSW